MKIKWNKIAILPKVLLIIILSGIALSLSFWIGKEYEKANSISIEFVDSRIQLLNDVYKGRIIAVEGEYGIKSKPKSKHSEDIVTTIIAKTPGNSANEEWVLTQTNDCGNYHVCSPKLGGVIFTKLNGKLTIKKVDKDVDRLGEFGNINTPEVVLIGNNISAFRIHDSHGNQGHFEGKLFLYTVINGEFKKVLSIPDAYMNGGEKADEYYYRYDTNLKFTPNQNSAYYDIEAEAVGTDMVDGKIISVKKIRLYKFDGTEYVLNN